MTTTTPPLTEQQPPVEPAEEGDRSTRRMLVVLLTILGIAALALLVLLFWLLRPESAPATSGPAGYPIQVVATIYGFGDAQDERLSFPIGVAFDADGNVWIANSGQARVEQYTDGGEFIRLVGAEEGPGKLSSPYGLAVDQARGRVYVADPAARLVQIYTTDGGYVGHFPADDQKLKVFGEGGFSPYDIGFFDGRTVVASNDGLYFFDDSGHVVARWGATIDGENYRGPGMGMFNFPDAFVIDEETGWLYVADSANRRVIAIDPDGFWKWVSGTPDADEEIKSFWQLPHGIELGPDGNLYVVDTFRFDREGMGTGHLVVLSTDGKLVSEFGRAGTEDGAFNYPEQLAVNGDGDLWAIADRENHRVVIFRLLTPYPEVDDILAHRYPETFERPENVWVTPPPTPPEREEQEGTAESETAGG